MVMAKAGDVLGVSDDWLFKDARSRATTKQGVISAWKQAFAKEVAGTAPEGVGQCTTFERAFLSKNRLSWEDGNVRGGGAAGKTHAPASQDKCATGGQAHAAEGSE